MISIETNDSLKNTGSMSLNQSFHSHPTNTSKASSNKPSVYHRALGIDDAVDETPQDEIIFSAPGTDKIVQT